MGAEADHSGGLQTNEREAMRKLIIIAASLVALAAVIATPFANAAVSYDNASVGHVDKTDIQNLFNWNNGTFQTKAQAGGIKFTSLYQMDNNANAWTCSDGNVYKYTLRTVQSRTLLATPVWNGNHSQILGFDLGGIDPTKGGTYVSGGRPNAPSPYVCPTGAYMTGFVNQTMDEQFVNTVLPGVQVTYDGTSFDLPNTPAV
jgi:hypothetical protein